MVHPIGRLDDFFALGGDSLLAVDMLARVGQELGCKVPLAELAASGTLASLAAAVRRTQEAARDVPGDARGRDTWCVVPLHSGGQEPPLFLVNVWSNGALLHRDLVHRLGATVLYMVERGRDDSPEMRDDRGGGTRLLGADSPCRAVARIGSPAAR